jgi:acyl-CoA thioesterase-1
VIAAAALAASTGWACRGRDSFPPASDRSSPTAEAPAPAASRPRIVVLGDSITAGLGLRPEESFPSTLQQKVDASGLQFDVINAGVSGDTTAGGLRRLDWSLEGDVRVVVVELGANDGLRGLPVSEMKRNLAAIIERARSRRAQVVLCGMEAPPNFGVAYTREFRAVFEELSREHQVAFVPFVLRGVAGDATLNQSDGIHPNSAGARKVAELVWVALEPLLHRAARHD